MGREHAVVRLDDGGRHLRRRVDGEGQLRLAAEAHREALEEQGAEAGAGATADGVEERKPWRPVQLSASLRMRSSTRSTISLPGVHTGVVVGGVLLAGDELLRVVELAVGAGADSSITVGSRSTKTVRVARAGLGKKVLKASSPPPMVLSEGTVGLDAVLEAVQLPARVTGLHALTQVDGDDLTHDLVVVWLVDYCETTRGGASLP